MIHLRWSKFIGAVPVVLALAGLAGCDKPNADDDSAEATSELSVEPAKEKGANEKGANERSAKGDKARGDHHHKKGHGPAMLLGAALHELDLTDAQKWTIQGELDALREGAGSREDHDEARAALAAAVRSGKVDEAALTSRFAPKAPDTARMAKAIGVLHDTLTAAQRKELVESVQARMDRFGGPDGERGPGKAREGKGDAREGREGKDRMRGPGEHGKFGPLGHLLAGLELSDAQRVKVQDALSTLAPSEAERDAMKAQHETFRAKMKERLASFAEGSFDANTFVALPEGGLKGGPDRMFGHMVKAVSAVLPILDETQRAELATRIEQGPAAHKMGKHGKDNARGKAD